MATEKLPCPECLCSRSAQRLESASPVRGHAKFCRLAVNCVQHGDRNLQVVRFWICRFESFRSAAAPTVYDLCERRREVDGSTCTFGRVLFLDLTFSSLFVICATCSRTRPEREGRERKEGEKGDKE